MGYHVNELSSRLCYTSKEATIPTRPQMYTVGMTMARTRKDGDLHNCAYCKDVIEQDTPNLIQHAFRPDRNLHFTLRFHTDCFISNITERFFARRKEAKTKTGGRPLVRIKEVIDKPEESVRWRRRTLTQYMSRDIRLYKAQHKEKKIKDFAQRLPEYLEVGYLSSIFKIVNTMALEMWKDPEYQSLIAENCITNGVLDHAKFAEWLQARYPVAPTQQRTDEDIEAAVEKRLQRIARSRHIRRTPSVR